MMQRELSHGAGTMRLGVGLNSVVGQGATALDNSGSHPYHGSRHPKDFVLSDTG